MWNQLILKYPSVFSVIPLASGVFISYFFGETILRISTAVILIAMILLLSLSGYFYYSILKNISNFIPFFLGTIFLFGFISLQYSFKTSFNHDLKRIASGLKSKQVKIFGTVIEVPEYRDGNIRVLVETDSVISDSRSFQIQSNIFATVYKIDLKNSFVRDISYGDVISVRGELSDLPEPRNPGEFNYGNYLKMQGISGIFTSFGLHNVEVLGKSNPNFFKKYIINPVKEYSVHIIDTKVRGTEGEFLKGLVLGERSNIPRQMKEDFVASGVSHLIAVSGLNVAYVIIIISGILMFFPIAYRYKVILLLAGLFFYMNLTGNVPSIIRATIMASVFLIAQLSERKVNGYNIISFSALIILLIDPRELFDAGFILSFSAILSLAYFYPKLNSLLSKIKLYENIKEDTYTGKIIKLVIKLLIGTIAAQIGTLPITALMFKKVSLVSFFTNIIAIPVSNIILALGFVVIICSLFSNFVSLIFVYTVSFLLHYLLRFINYFSGFDYSYIETYEVDYLLLFTYYAVLFLVISIMKQNYVQRLIITLLIIMNYYLYRNILYEESGLTLSYLFVGDSKCCIITSPEDETVLINTGTFKGNYNSAERNVIPYLKSKGINDVKTVLITSMDKNEFRNLLYFVSHFNVGEIIMSNYYKTLFEDKNFSKYFTSIELKYLTKDTSHIFRDFKIFELIEPKITSGNRNEPEMLVGLLYGKQNFLFTDKADFVNKNLYLKANSIFNNCSVLKVPSYGSFDFISPEEIAIINPSYIVISSSDKIRKRYDTQLFKNSLLLSGIDVIKTGEDGAALFKSDGDKVDRIKWR